MRVHLRVRASRPVDDFVFGVGIFNAEGVCVYGTNTEIEGFSPQALLGRRRRVPVLRIARSR
jgi:lipopolysaccharide transport system ATP-binding protein